MQTDSTDCPPVLDAARLAHLENRRAAFPPLDQVTRPTLTTREAAYYLNRAEQTLRCWAMNDDGPLRPLRINGRLAWPLVAMKRLTGVAA